MSYVLNSYLLIYL